MRRELGTEGFLLGAHTLACRWRLHGGTLPLRGRHFRALRMRTLRGIDMDELAAWTSGQVDDLLRTGCAGHPDGVALLVLDADGGRMVTAVRYEPLAKPSPWDLAERAAKCYLEAQVTGVAAETLWVVRDRALLWGGERGFAPSGATALLAQLARKLGIQVMRTQELHAMVASDPLIAREAFLVSDEHGVVLGESCGPMVRKLGSSFSKHLGAGRP